MQASKQDELLQRLTETVERLSYNSDWNPAYSGDSQMRIARDGRWFYQGTVIARPALVQLFSRLLRREGDAYFLVTPVEKLSIAVEDAPFVSINIEVQGEGQGQVVYVTTNLEDTLAIGPENPLEVITDPQTQQPSPYVSIVGNLAVLVQRSDFYQLVEYAEQAVVDGQSVMGIWSSNTFYVLGAL